MTLAVGQDPASIVNTQQIVKVDELLQLKRKVPKAIIVNDDAWS